jgi:hypothetical protein
MTDQYTNAIRSFTDFVKSFGHKYPLTDSKGSISGMIDRVNDFGDTITKVNDDATNKANELLATIDDPVERESFKTAIVPVLQKGMKDLFEGN